jgi:hypothetical protein
VSQVGGRAHLVGIQGMDRKGKIEQVYAANGDSVGEARQISPAVFVNGGRCVVFHSVESCCLVWNKAKGEILSGLDHGDSKSSCHSCWLFVDLVTSDVDDKAHAVAVSVHAFVYSLRR